MVPMMPRLSRATRCDAARGLSGAGGLLTKYAASCTVAPSAVLGRITPAESIVMKELLRFCMMPTTSLSERRGILGQCLLREWMLCKPTLPDSLARCWLDMSAASLRLMRSPP